MISAKVSSSNKKRSVSRYIYGHFAEHLGRCIYEGLYVGEDSPIPNVNGIRCDVVDALREIKIPVLRWPGGCFADDYHWRDGIGDKSKRPYMVNTNWGFVSENNHFGTHEFFELVKQLDTEAYICGNVGSGTVQEMRDWVEYMTFGGKSPLSDERAKNGSLEPFKLKFFGVGNESWGCGGNMRPEYYADLYRRYQTFIRNNADEPIYKIACGANAGDYNWTRVLMREAGNMMDGISLHYYTLPGDWQNKGDAVNFDEMEWDKTISKALVMDELISGHEKIMDEYDPEKRVGLIVDEWGTWFDVMQGTNPGFLYQQNTMRDAVVAVLTLHIFHKHCERVKMANLAQLVNVLQAPILTEGEKMVKTPTYYVLKMLKEHQDAELLDVNCSIPYENNIPKISISATKKNNEILVSMCNTRLDNSLTVSVNIDGISGKDIEATLLSSTDVHAFNSFDEPQKVIPRPAEAKLSDDTITAQLPPASVLTVKIK